nr:imidazole glycerol phosphate synthase subunit HisH [uncultured Methanoregula sp.]
MVSDVKKSTVAIVDLGMGNLFSIKHACDYVGLDGFLTSSPGQISDADAIILPGMGAFGDAMIALESLSLIDTLQESVTLKKPLLGICLGMQIFMSYGTEFGYHKGLGFIDGRVERFQNPVTDTMRLKVPQNGWNRLHKTTILPDPWTGTPLSGLPDGVYMYFNHSYYVIPESSDVIIATTTYGDCNFCSAVKKENLIGLQCHPERSGKTGLAVYRNFAGMIEQYI